jgi:putative peptide zinc metalloprotease protein
MPVIRGQRVKRGERLMVFASPDLDYRKAAIAARLTAKLAELEAVRLDPMGRERLSALAEELSRLEAEQTAAQAEAERLILTAPQDGVILDIAPDLRPGDWVSPRQALGLVRADARPQAIAYVADEDLDRIATGARASFVPRSLDHRRLTGMVSNIDHSPITALTEPALAAAHGGEIPVRLQGQTLVPQGGYHRVIVTLDGMPPDIRLMGQVEIAASGQSLLGRTIRAALVVLMREWGA